jgi:hypothetical protein
MSSWPGSARRRREAGAMGDGIETTSTLSGGGELRGRGSEEPMQEGSQFQI